MFTITQTLSSSGTLLYNMRMLFFVSYHRDVGGVRAMAADVRNDLGAQLTMLDLVVT